MKKQEAFDLDIILHLFSIGYGLFSLGFLVFIFEGYLEEISLLLNVSLTIMTVIWAWSIIGILIHLAYNLDEVRNFFLSKKTLKTVRG